MKNDLEIIDYELKLVQESKEILMGMLEKKRKNKENIQLIKEALDGERQREQELLTERLQQETSSSDK